MRAALPGALHLSVFRPCLSPRPISSPIAAMGTQKRIESFFVSSAAKRSKTAEGEEGAPSTSGAAEDAGPANGAPSAPATDGNGVAAAAPASAAAAAGDLHAAQVAAMQSMRAAANKNAALAKQVVIRAEQAGAVPALTDLLIELSWRDLLGDQLTKPYFSKLQAFVAAEWGGSKPVFPPKDSIFRAFNTCPVDKVRVVILGQDPYHNYGQAMGLSFSVPRDKPLPSSLRNIYKELAADLGCAPAAHGCLEKWAHQGVLLLNAVLTVRAHEAASHGKRGWEDLTDAAIAKLSKERSGLVFLLWGKYAQDKGKVIDRSRHTVLTSPHPSGLSAHRGFFGCRHFSACNEALQARGHLPIDWCVE